MASFKKLEMPLFLIIFAAILWIGQIKNDSAYVYQGDDLRYMNYAISLHEHGIFGLNAVPGNANAPLYPAFIAGTMALDAPLAQSLNCLIESGKKANCAQNFENFFMAQSCLALLCLFLIYLIALHLSKNHAIAWAAAFLAVGSGVFLEFSNLFMTEIIILPAFCALILFCLRLYQDNRLRWIIAIALSLAVLTLIRPSYLYLFYGFVLFFGTITLYKRDKSSLLRAILLITVFIAAVAPWAIRNKIQFNSFTLTTGGYAEAILIQRTNYNQMSWPEIGVAMIYWLPDFGDSLAEKIFPAHLHNKLGWHEKSYYRQGYNTRITELSEELGDRDKIFGHLIRQEVLTPKHVAVSIPLAIRGVFIAKYWGLAGFIAFLSLLAHTIRRNDYSLLVISLPVFYMVAFHAGVSVSIPRYNLPLIALYALSMAWYLNLYGLKLVSKIRNT